MKPKNIKDAVFRPFIVAVIALVMGVGWIVYCYFKTDSNTISYVFGAIVLAIAVYSFMASCYQFYLVKLQEKILANGTLCKAQYVSNDSRISTKKATYYYVLLSVDNNGHPYHLKSSNELTWEEILAIKSAEEIDIVVLNGKFVIQSNLDMLRNQYSQKIASLQQKYDMAYNNVENIVVNQSENISTRVKTTVEKKKEKKIIAEEEKPDAEDDK